MGILSDGPRASSNLLCFSLLSRLRFNKKYSERHRSFPPVWLTRQLTPGNSVIYRRHLSVRLMMCLISFVLFARLQFNYRETFSSGKGNNNFRCNIGCLLGQHSRSQKLFALCTPSLSPSHFSNPARFDVFDKLKCRPPLSPITYHHLIQFHLSSCSSHHLTSPHTCSTTQIRPVFRQGRLVFALVVSPLNKNKQSHKKSTGDLYLSYESLIISGAERSVGSLTVRHSVLRSRSDTRLSLCMFS